MPADHPLRHHWIEKKTVQRLYALRRHDGSFSTVYMGHNPQTVAKMLEDDLTALGEIVPVTVTVELRSELRPTK